MGYSPWGCKELDSAERLSTCRNTEKLVLRGFFMLLFSLVVSCFNVVLHVVGGFSILFLLSDALKRYHVGST